jgi:LPXTG-motif cell wall-anchored protein
LRARPITRIFSLAIAVAGLLALPTAALAYAPSVDAFVTCTPSIVAVGDQVSCVASVSVGGTTVTVTVDSPTDPTPLFTTTSVADANGQILFSFAAATAGVLQVSISGTRSGEAFTTFTTITALDTSVLGVAFDRADDRADGAAGGAVADDSAEVLGVVLDAEIASTGSDAGMLAVVAIGAVAIGGGTLFASRRHRLPAA